MTEGECLSALSDLFGASATKGSGCWNISIATDPRRELVFAPQFVEKHIDQENLSPKEFTEVIRGLDDQRWHEQEDGSLLASFGFLEGDYLWKI